MVEFPGQTKGHMVEKIISSDLAKGQFGLKDPISVQHVSDIVKIQFT